MKIHSAEIRHVRQIKELKLDLSAPLTLIGGPNGVGKTTVQQAILAALFSPDKKIRDSLISRFDADTPPTATLGLSRGDPTATIILSRLLTDDKGEWKEGANTIKKKGQALKEVQKDFPISADAAAVLLWGRQEDMTTVIEDFPSDGHTLLTTAATRGAGPDPKEIIAGLQKDIENARKGEKGGQVVGSLTQAVRRVDSLSKELAQARGVEEDVKTRRLQWEQAKSQRDETKATAKQAEEEIARLDKLEKLLDAAVHDQTIVSEMEARQNEWAGLEDEISAARKTLVGLEKELEQLRAQYRVARDQELGKQIENLRAKVKQVQEVDNSLAEVEKELRSKERPEPADQRKYQQLQAQINQARDKMEASGVRYEISSATGPRAMRVAEDGAPEKEIVLQAGETHQGIVGRLTLDVDGLHFTAAGKEDVSKHKRVIVANRREMDALLKKFSVKDEVAFLKLATEKEELNQKLKEKQTARKVQLGTFTSADLAGEVELLERARAENNMSLKDKEVCAGKYLSSASELEVWCGHKQGEIGQAKESLAALEEKRPNEPERVLHTNNLETLRRKSRESTTAFREADELHREPSRELLRALRTRLEKQRSDQTAFARGLIDVERRVAELDGQLKQTIPHRPIGLIEEELREAKESLHQEQVLQEARSELIERIQNKISALAAHVPVELGNKITEHLRKLTGGAFSGVRLHSGLALSAVGENGQQNDPWHPGQLSHGERHLAALVVKIAVASALAETAGAVFVMLDDSLVTFDPRRRGATENWLLELVAGKKLQVILFTCHTDWAADWKKRQPELVRYIELAKEARYYREPPSLLAPVTDGDG
jgi:energy-coupling factor transporter ATP-binding protein EcfA2